ncbi:sugar nucleotide-binding protein [Serratia nevei]|uniref:sugar nucleotide-binding protein n=1 Tax=Serratia nevei TaxID=2703794 RepID=UPI00254EA7F4|nr:sugar nucleotide-binding protein [Serratia nevei]MDK4773486.1 sugar nucleotide-binding protein [Serratia nevei]
MVRQKCSGIRRSYLGQGTLTRLPQVNDITTDQYPTPAKRPAYSSLDCGKIESLGIQPSDWQQALKNIMPVLGER